MTHDEIIEILQADIKDLDRERNDLLSKVYKIENTMEHIEYLIKVFKGTKQC